MKRIALQVSPEAKAAYFADYQQVAKNEFAWLFAGVDHEYRVTGPFEYIALSQDATDLQKLLRLSFAQGVYALENDLLQPLEDQAQFFLHEDFVFGSKYRGKTNERLTQMLINVGLAAIGKHANGDMKLLDPMCGRGTTLLWAMRYGLQARGIEQDPAALDDIHRHLKKWTKLHRQKHRMADGFVGGKKSKTGGQFLEFDIGHCAMRVTVGDARDADQLYKHDKFDLLVSDLPYGVQHRTTERTRNPLAVIEQCLDAWSRCLKKQGAMVLAFNSNNPKRSCLVDVLEKHGLSVLSFEAAHRMSESIVRDVIVVKHGETVSETG